MPSIRLVSVSILLLASFCAYSQNPDQCTPTTTQAKIYEFTAEGGNAGLPSGSSSSNSARKGKLGSITVPNNVEVVVRLKDINPYLNKCSVSTSTQAFSETAIASFLGQLGGIGNVSSASTPDAAKATGGPKGALMVESVQPNQDWKVIANGKPLTITSNDCADNYMTGAHHEAAQLQQERDAINSALAQMQLDKQTVQSTFNQAVIDLTRTKGCSAIVASAKALAFPSSAPPVPPSGVPLDQRIDTTAFQAQRLLTHLTDGTEACKQQLNPVIDADSAFLQALVQGTSSVSSAVDKWRTQLKTLNSLDAAIQKARGSVAAVLANPQNFIIDTPIHGNQQSVTVTMACSQVPLQTISVAASDSSQQAPPAATAPPSSPSPSKSDSSNPTFEVRFGDGPRFVFAGGVVISPLQQVTFSTTATPGGSGATANTIIRQQNSSTRVLPIAMLHGRYWDMIPKHEYKKCLWIPNYFSAGITAKSTDNNGTSIEYLFGPSWGLAGRQLFITAGAYAGRQQRLANSLTVGSTTSLGSSNLPTTQTLVWKAGFAITWAPAGK